VPGGGLAPGYERWIGCKPGFFLPVRVLSRLFRRLFLEALEDAFYQRKLQFFGETETLQDAIAFNALTTSMENREWVVCQATLRRCATGTGIPGPLHASRGDLE
jgi:hypothetical protein